jgi:hypothetical protein
LTLLQLLDRLSRLPADDVTEMMIREVRLLVMPLDLDALIKAGKLQRLSATRYRLLVPLHALPDYVTAQAVDLDGSVLHFARCVSRG